jgi:hypothetical protein
MKRFILILGLLLLCSVAVTGAFAAAGTSAAPKGVRAAPLDTPTATPTCRPSWTTVTSPTLELREAELYKVDAVSASDIWAAGIWYSGTVGTRPGREEVLSPHKVHAKHTDQPNRVMAEGLIDHWNGTSWTVITGTNAGLDENYLLSVSAASANDVWAAGYYINDLGVAQTLIKHFDGSNWSIVPSANSSPLTDNQLFSVRAFSANDVWAVGTYASDAGAFQTLAEHWNGTGWSVVASPNSGLYDNVLRDVTVVSANDAWAVGYYVNESLRGDRALTEHWNGTAWSIIANPGVGSGSNFFNGVDGVTTNDVWAVGEFSTISGSGRVLLEHWNGTAWNVVPGGHIDADYANINSVDAVASNDVWVVGSYINYQSSYYYEALTEHWNGTAWTVVPTANVAASRQDELYAIAGVGLNDAWAVGLYVQDGQFGSSHLALVEHYSTACIPLNCRITFTDVQPSDYYYYPVLYLYCRGVVSGYGNNTFQPGNNTTRAQLSKIVTLAEGWDIINSQQQHFTDVSPWDTFFSYIETAYSHGIISGYTCTSGTPVPEAGCLEFRPGNNITRAQLSKVIVLAQGWTLYTPPTPTFVDVPATHAFYQYIETAYAHSVVSGYNDGTFRPGNNATRGQIAKIVFSAVTQP